jgi:hypothetical protein
MVTHPRALVLALLSSLASSFLIGGHAAAAGLYGLEAPDRIEGKYIVVLNADAPTPFGRIGNLGRQGVRDLADTMSAEFEFKTDWIYGVAAKGFSASMSESQALRISRDPRVKFVEVDKIARGNGVQSNPGFALDRIDQPSGTNGSYVYDNDGRNVTVYVLDSGVRTTHVEFEPSAGQYSQRVWPAFTAIMTRRDYMIVMGMEQPLHPL